MEHNETFIKERVASNYKIATFVFTIFLVTIAGVTSLYQKGELGTLFVVGLGIALVFFLILLVLIWSNHRLIDKLKQNGN